MKEVIENNSLLSIYLFENKKCKTKWNQRGKWNAQNEIIHSSKERWINQIVKNIICLWSFLGTLTLLWKKKHNILMAKSYEYYEKWFRKIVSRDTKLKAKAAAIKSRNLHMWSSFLKPSSAALKRLWEENVPQAEEHPDEAIVVVGKSIQIIVQLFSMLEL